MPRYVVADGDSIPEWLFPGSFPEIETPDSLCLTVSAHLNLEQLWQALREDADTESLYAYQSYDEVGIPHNAPDVDRLCDAFLDDLCAVPRHERFMLIRKWLGNVNEATLGHYKRILNQLCDLAQLARTQDKSLVLLPDYEK